MKPNQQFQFLKFGAAVLLCAMFVFSLSGTAQAVELVSGSSLPAGETVDDDVVISGENVVIDGDVNGNLIAFGNTVTINGEVSGDIIAFGSWVIVNGKVSGNVFSGAQTIEVNGEVAGSLFGGSASLELGPEAKLGSNVYSGSYNLEAQKGSTIERDLAAGAYQVFLDGEIGRDARVGAAALELNGSVGRDLIASVEAPGARSFMPFQLFPKQPNAPVMPEPADPGLRIGPEASIGGELIYTSPASQEAAIQATPAGGVVYQTPVPKETTRPEEAPKQKPAGFGLLGWLFKLVREIIGC